MFKGEHPLPRIFNQARCDMTNQGWPEDDKWPTPEEQQRLFREWREDYGQAHLRNRGVRYEDEPDRTLDDQPPQRRPRQRDRGHER